MCVLCSMKLQSATGAFGERKTERPGYLITVGGFLEIFS